jgi:hypothetical protein
VCFPLGDRLERSEGVRPKPVEIGPERGKAGRVHNIYVTSAFWSVCNETSVLEHPEVLRDGGAADWKLASQFADSAWAFHKLLENGATGAVAESVPGVNVVSHN